MTKLRLGVVGLGRIADGVHLPTLHSFPDVEIAAVCDVDPARLRTMAAKYGVASAYDDHRVMIRDAGLDGVLVLSAPQAIAPVALDTLRAGIGTFLEKPPGLTLHEAEELRDTSDRTGAVAMVGFNRRFQPLVQEAKRRIETAGPVASVLIEFHPFNFGHYAAAGFTEEALTHFHAAQSIHAVDLLCYLGGEVVAAVYGQVRNHFSNYGDTFSGMIEFASGATGHVICNYTSPTRIERAELHGDGILVVLDGMREKVQSQYSFAQATIYQGDMTTEMRNARPDDAYNGGYYQEVRYFVDCIRAHQTPVRPGASMADAVQTMAVIDAILANRRGPLAIDRGR